ncbi:hypothetical protein L873DRAFT_1787457 [Choiromyces venosus 120613-1]|uniref:Uncharacterized protein n=1 Tax=Choiromyces venosus 120613-1 TaxID=1336337 RepID=A0A3N4JZR7_9PEZI|nr:hypothetical protein L873DRAFT_1787457 [Choiromyces venosus 120613-1]
MRGYGITKTVSELTMNDSKMVDQTPKLKFEDNLDSLDGVCDVAARGPECTIELPYARSPRILYKRKYFQELEKQQSPNNSYEFLDGWRRSVDGWNGLKHDALGIPISQPISLHAPTSGFSCQEAERVEENNSVFAWIEAVVITGRHLSETKTTTSPMTDDLIDLSTTNLLLPGALQDFYL